MVRRIPSTRGEIRVGFRKVQCNVSQPYYYIVFCDANFFNAGTAKLRFPGRGENNLFLSSIPMQVSGKAQIAFR